MQNEGKWQQQITSVHRGKRSNYQILARGNSLLSVACAVDYTDADAATREIEQLTTAHQRTLDDLPTPVAVFGSDKHLVYYNNAWQKLWELETTFLAEKPEEGAILDRLRAARKLPEQADYKAWKAQHLEAYQKIEPRETLWHCPDGRTLRVFTHPHPQGGITSSKKMSPK